MTRSAPVLVCVLCVALALTTATAEAGKKGVEKETLDFDGLTRTYYLYVPEGLSAAQPAPLVLLLHGSGRDGMSLMDKWKKLATKEGIVLVAPDATDEKGWSWRLDRQEFLGQVISNVMENANIDNGRLYIFGHSAGACLALGLALEQSDYYAAIAVHAGALTIDRVADTKRKVPISIQVGTEDRYFPLDAVRQTRDAFQDAGFPVELIEIKGHTHWYYDSSKKINQHAWEFLSSHQLD